MNQGCTCSKVADKHIKCGRKEESVETAGDDVSQRVLFLALLQTQELEVGMMGQA